MWKQWEWSESGLQIIFAIKKLFIITRNVVWTERIKKQWFHEIEKKQKRWKQINKKNKLSFDHVYSLKTKWFLFLNKNFFDSALQLFDHYSKIIQSAHWTIEYHWKSSQLNSKLWITLKKILSTYTKHLINFSDINKTILSFSQKVVKVKWTCWNLLTRFCKISEHFTFSKKLLFLKVVHNNFYSNYNKSGRALETLSNDISFENFWHSFS